MQGDSEGTSLERAVDAEKTKEPGTKTKYKVEEDRTWLTKALIYLWIGTIAVGLLQFCSYEARRWFGEDGSKSDSSKLETLSQEGTELFTFLVTAQTGIVGSVVGFYFGTQARR